MKGEVEGGRKEGSQGEMGGEMKRKRKCKQWNGEGEKWECKKKGENA